MRPPLPPFDAQSAAQKARAAEDAWNTRDPAKVALAYTEDSVWRNRAEFLNGRDEIRAFLTRGTRHEQAREVLARFSMPVCPAMLTHRAAFGDAGTLGRTALDHDPNGKAAQEIQLVYKYTTRLLNEPTRRETDNEQSRLIRSAN